MAERTSKDCTHAGGAWLVSCTTGTSAISKTDHLCVILAQSKLRVRRQELVKVHQILDKRQLLLRGLVLRVHLQCLLKLVLGTFVFAG